MIMSRSFLLWMRNMSDKIVESIRTHSSFSNIICFCKSCCLWENVEKHFSARQPIACWIPMSNKTHTQNMSYLLLFHSNNGSANAPQCFAIRKLLVLQFSKYSLWIHNKLRGFSVFKIRLGQHRKQLLCLTACIDITASWFICGT
jgi:hypothetical protein